MATYQSQFIYFTANYYNLWCLAICVLISVHLAFNVNRNQSLTVWRIIRWRGVMHLLWSEFFINEISLFVRIFPYVNPKFYSNNKKNEKLSRVKFIYIVRAPVSSIILSLLCARVIYFDLNNPEPRNYFNNSLTPKDIVIIFFYIF